MSPNLSPPPRVNAEEDDDERIYPPFMELGPPVAQTEESIQPTRVLLLRMEDNCPGCGRPATWIYQRNRWGYRDRLAQLVILCKHCDDKDKGS